MKKYFSIVYEVEGTRELDTVDFFAASKEEAVDLFTNHDFGGLKYTKYAIVEVL